MTTLNELLEELLRDPAFREEYDALKPEFAAIQAEIDARKEKEKTQKN